jgi:hypothetical protein
VTVTGGAGCTSDLRAGMTPAAGCGRWQGHCGALMQSRKERTPRQFQGLLGPAQGLLVCGCLAVRLLGAKAQPERLGLVPCPKFEHLAFSVLENPFYGGSPPLQEKGLSRVKKKR